MVSPGMSDGRMFTEYTSNCQLNKSLMQSFAKTTNNEYRKYLQTNAEFIMKDFESKCKGKCEKESI
jgi:hypothetical protein